MPTEGPDHSGVLPPGAKPEPMQQLPRMRFVDQKSMLVLPYAWQHHVHDAFEAQFAEEHAPPASAPPMLTRVSAKASPKPKAQAGPPRDTHALNIPLGQPASGALEEP